MVPDAHNLGMGLANVNGVSALVAKPSYVPSLADSPCVWLALATGAARCVRSRLDGGPGRHLAVHSVRPGFPFVPPFILTDACRCLSPAPRRYKDAPRNLMQLTNYNPSLGMNRDHQFHCSTVPGLVLNCSCS